MSDRPNHVFPKSGRLEWIGLAAARRAPVRSVAATRVEVASGLADEHHTGKDRQVTIIQKEHLPAVAALLGVPAVAPELLRRNLLVSGINVQSLKRRRFTVGEVLLEGTGDCHPCSRMEENLGAGGYNAMAGHGGITAKVIAAGTIRAGDAVTAAEEAGEAAEA